MREILFKAKRKDNGKWAEGYYQKRYDAFGNAQHLIFWAKSCAVWEYVEIDPYTLCQFTGMHEKSEKKKKIWEWDLVRRTDLRDSKEPSVGVIEYDAENTSFLIHWIDVINYSATYPWKDRIEVIGSIFDDPELLEATVEELQEVAHGNNYR